MVDFAFFEVDCREGESFGEFSLRPRVEVLRPALARLQNLARETGSPFLYTVCCSGQVPRREGFAHGFIPFHMEKEDREKLLPWEKTLARQRVFYLERKTYGNPQANHDHKCFETLAQNSQALGLVQAVNPRVWVVYGNALDACVDHVVVTLLGLGAPVWFLSDVLVSGATGYGESGTVENRIRTLEKWRALGAVDLDMEQLEKQLQAFYGRSA